MLLLNMKNRKLYVLITKCENIRLKENFFCQKQTKGQICKKVVFTF